MALHASRSQIQLAVRGGPIAAFLPDSLMRPYLRFGRYGMVVLILLVFVAPLFAARAGIRFDIFGSLVIGPAETLTRTLLSLIGRG